MKRRTFVRAGATASAAAVLLPRPSSAVASTIRADLAPRGVGTPSLDPAFMRRLATRAIEAATAAGATYAEARVTRTVQQLVLPKQASESEDHGMSVRALIKGGWGFATGPFWTEDNAAQLGNNAARQATQNATYVPTPIGLAHAPVVTGEWTSPMKIDLFSIPIEEKMDFRQSVNSDPVFPIVSTRNEHVLATSEGTAIAQTMYGLFWRGARDGLTLNGVGWEDALVVDDDIQFQHIVESLHSPALTTRTLPVKPAEIGRYTVMLGPIAMQQMLPSVVGLPLNLDRITLRSANTAGTSYLGTDPVALLGHYDFGTPLLSVVAVPGMPGRWDNEGVTPERVPLITNGILQDFYTTREQAMWLDAAYQKLGRPMKSHGYAAFGDWDAEPSVALPTLRMLPHGSASTADLIATISRGLYIETFDSDALAVGIATDQQARQFTFPFLSALEIVNGRPSATIGRAAISFDAVQLWKNLDALGGPQSQFGSAVPCVFKDIALINPMARRG